MGEEERDRLVLAHLPLVEPSARALLNSLPHHAKIHEDDLIQAGRMGLMDAAIRFKPEKGVEFGTFARYRIRGAMLDCLRNVDAVSREHRRTVNRLRRAQHELWSRLGRKPDSEELAQELGVTLQKLAKLLLLASSAEQGLEIFERTADPADLADQVIYRQQMIAIVRKAVERLPERDATIVRLYYWEGKNGREIGEFLGLSQGRISQIMSLCLAKIAGELPS